MKLKCIKEVEGFTIGKNYKLLGCAGEYLELKADTGERLIVEESCFEIVKSRFSLSLLRNCIFK